MRRFPVMLNSDLPSVGSGERPYLHNDELNRAYGHFFSRANGGGEEMAFGSAYDFVGDGTIAGHWVPRDWSWAPVFEPVSASFVFDKLGMGNPHFEAVVNRTVELGIPIFGHVGLCRFVGSKWRCYEAFPDYHALTRRLEPDPSTVEDQLDTFFDLMDETYAEHHEAALLKPDFGWESRGIYLLTRRPEGLELRHWWGQPITDAGFIRHVLEQLARIPYVIQAFVYTCEGIPELELHGARHDARFVFEIRGPGVARFVQSYVKTLDRGMLYYPPERYPRAALEVVEAVAERLATMFPYGIFSVDVMRDVSGRWYLTELNDQIGFNIHWSQHQDFEGVDHLMRTYLDAMRRMRENAGDARYRSAV